MIKDQAAQFREEALEKGLIFADAGSAHVPFFMFDLNNGDIFAPADPVKLAELAKLAEKYNEADALLYQHVCGQGK